MEENHGTERLTDNYLLIDYQLESIGSKTQFTQAQSNIQSLELYELIQNQVWDFLLASLKEYIK